MCFTCRLYLLDPLEVRAWACQAADKTQHSTAQHDGGQFVRLHRWLPLAPLPERHAHDDGDADLASKSNRTSERASASSGVDRRSLLLLFGWSACCSIEFSSVHDLMANNNQPASQQTQLIIGVHFLLGAFSLVALRFSLVTQLFHFLLIAFQSHQLSRESSAQPNKIRYLPVVGSIVCLFVFNLFRHRLPPVGPPIWPVNSVRWSMRSRQCDERQKNREKIKRVARLVPVCLQDARSTAYRQQVTGNTWPGEPRPNGIGRPFKLEGLPAAPLLILILASRAHESLEPGAGSRSIQSTGE